MNKVLIRIYVPALQKWFDVLVPNFLKTKDIVSLLGMVISEVTDGLYYPSGEEILCSCDSKKTFKSDKSLGDYGVLNGERILFM